jgi:hypothetical protein
MTQRRTPATCLVCSSWRSLLYHCHPPGAGVAQENITIQNNRFLNNGEEGVVFFYSTTTAIDTIRILNNDFRQNGGERLGLREHRWGHRPPRPGPQRGH